MKTKIITLLKEAGTYVSGQQLCEQFGVSRTAVWKAIRQLRKEGYVIEAVTGKGYLFTEQAEVYSKSGIASLMQTKWAGRQLYFHESIGSTNVEAKRLAENGAPHGTLVVADMQTAGRGRRGRQWISPAGTNIYFTLLLRPEFAPDKASMLTLVIAHAITRTFRDRLGLDARIKWPNDVVIGDRKTCGILTEMSVEQADIRYVVIGVGINVRKQEFAPEIADRAIALDEVATLAEQVDRSALVAEIMKSFEEDYEIFLRTCSMDPLRESYDRLLVNLDREVCVLDPAGEYRGIARGINGRGELIVELPDGSRRDVYAGEVSVRGIYGYT